MVREIVSNNLLSSKLAPLLHRPKSANGNSCWCVKNVLNKGGYFIFDINSFYGFDEIAQGTISVEDKDNFAVLNSLFDGEKMETNITLFENKKECYKKEEGSIIQYFHKINKIKNKI